MSISDRKLRDMAANRGFRLAKSRIRTPGRKDYGKYGLRDAQSGREAFGFSRHRLTASAEEIEDHLRGLAELGWKASLRKRPKKGA
jgi:hypothetical protein